MKAPKIIAAAAVLAVTAVPIALSGIYSFRSMISVLVTDTHAAGPTRPVAPAVVDAARTAVDASEPAARPGSLLVGYSTRRSATL